MRYGEYDVADLQLIVDVVIIDLAVDETYAETEFPAGRRTRKGAEGRKNSIRTIVSAVMRCYTPY